MTSITPWLSVTLFGFVYVLAGAFLFLSYAGKNHLAFIKHIQPYAPYVAVAILFLSYLIGLMAHLLSQQLWATYFHPADTYNARKLIAMQTKIPPELLASVGGAYDTLVIYRHLCISSICLGVSLFVWLQGFLLRRLKWSLLIGCLFLALFFSYVYFVDRQQYLDLLSLSQEFLH